MELYSIGFQTVAPPNRAAGNSRSESVPPLPLSGTDQPAADTYEPSASQGITYDRSGTVRQEGDKTGREDGGRAGAKRGDDGEPLTRAEEARVRELKATDIRVRAHEQAHMAAGGGLIKGGAHYSYTTGPDGNRYVVGGEVSIDTSEGNTPAETINRMQRVRAAALAPADPSPQDRSVASAAAAKSAQAAQELADGNRAKLTQRTDTTGRQEAVKAY